MASKDVDTSAVAEAPAAATVAPTVPATFPGWIEAVERRQMLSAHVAGSSTVYPTIQAAVDAAPVGGTVTVDPGSYQELIVIDTPGLTVQGAQANVDARATERGAESIVRGTDVGNGLRSSSFV